jgi:hypothetical protein
VGPEDLGPAEDGADRGGDLSQVDMGLDRGWVLRDLVLSSLSSGPSPSSHRPDG